MSKDTEERVRELNATWWREHQALRKLTSDHDANQYAYAVLHWHCNVESARRHRPSEVDGARFFLHGYTVSALRAWLNNAQDKLDEATDWELRRDLECLVRNLQVALDDIAFNEQARKS